MTITATMTTYDPTTHDRVHLREGDEALKYLEYICTLFRDGSPIAEWVDGITGNYDVHACLSLLQREGVIRDTDERLEAFRALRDAGMPGCRDAGMPAEYLRD